MAEPLAEGMEEVAEPLADDALVTGGEIHHRGMV